MYLEMGIHNLNKILKSKCPQVFKTVHLSTYAYKKVAIDISLYMCKFKVIFGDDWLSAFVNLVSCLRRNDIHCVFIYDNGAPPEKSDEKASRLEHKKKIEAKVVELLNALDHYSKTKEVNQILIDFYEKRHRNSPPKLLNSNIKVDINVVREDVNKMQNQVINISPADYETTRELFRILQVPFFHATLEAETTCSDLCINKYVDGVMSEDTDVLAYGAPVFLTKVDTQTDTCVEINYSEILNLLEVSSEQFLDICIMCGTDYNKNIYKIGPEKAYKYIKQYGSIDSLPFDITVLNHIRVRELFRNYKRLELDKISHCGQPDFIVLSDFLNIHKIKVDIDIMKDSFLKSDLVFVDEDIDMKE